MNDIESKSNDRSTVMAGDMLSGRVALVTGGIRCIGRDRPEPGQPGRLGGRRLHRQHGAQSSFSRSSSGTSRASRATVHQGNVSRPEDCRRVVQEVIDQDGRLDILINNGGITIDKLAMQMSVQDGDSVLAVNLSGSFYEAQPALEHMVERGTGRIIFVSSVIGETGNIGQANYAASKAGMLGLTKTLAKEAAFILKRTGKAKDAGIGITVNTVIPGLGLPRCSPTFRRRRWRR